MADCGENCDCADCCITPVTYTNNRHAAGIVLAAPAAFAPPGGAGGDYANDILPSKSYLPIERYTTAELDGVIDAIQKHIVPLLISENNVISKVNKVNRKKYPELNDKLNSTGTASPITRVEAANFISEFNLLPITVSIIAVSNPSKLASMLNGFFSLALAGIALCSFLAAPFGIMSIVENLKNLAVGLLDSAKALIDGVVTTAAAIVAGIKEFVEKAKEVIDNIAQVVKDKIQNLADGFKNTIDSLTSGGFKLGPAFKAIAQQMSNLVDKVTTFFSGENISKMKQSLEDAIVNAAKGFGQLTVDIVDQLLYVFCGVTTGIEKNANEKVEEVETFATNIEENVNLLSGSSNFATNSAIEAGRPVPTPASLAQQCVSYADAINSAPAGSLPAVVHTPEYTSLPAPTEWSNLRFGSRILSHPVFVGPKKIYMYDYPHLATDEDEHGPFLTTPLEAFPPDAAYRGMKLECLEKANACAKSLGLTFSITSAYRPYPHQQQIRNENGGRHIGGGRRNLRRYPPGCRISGVALHSQHSKGVALDISKGSLGNVARTTAAMRAHGFGGVGTYNTFMHYDLGPVRSW